jgi:hypothetical protein
MSFLILLISALNSNSSIVIVLGDALSCSVAAIVSSSILLEFTTSVSVVLRLNSAKREYVEERTLGSACTMIYLGCAEGSLSVAERSGVDPAFTLVGEM